MKRKAHLVIIAFMLLWLPQLLHGQQNQTFSQLKPGDWFDVKVDFNYSACLNNYQTQYYIKYQLNDILSNGNKSYRLTVERTKMKMLFRDGTQLGMDSYYPAYLQNNQQSFSKPVFMLTLNNAGVVTGFKTDGGISTINLYRINSPKVSGGMFVSLPVIPTEIAEFIAKVIGRSMGVNGKNVLDGQLVKDDSGKKATLAINLADASFPLPQNTVIMGKIHNLPGGGNNELSIGDKKIRIDADGSFKEADRLTDEKSIDIGYNHSYVPLFITPGDTLFIDADAKDIEATAKFTGKSAAGAQLGIRLYNLSQAQQQDESKTNPKLLSAVDFVQLQKQEQAAFNNIISAYKNKIAVNVYHYYQSQFLFEQASKKLNYLSRTKYKSTPQAAYSFRGFPEGFFLSVDTLTVLMNNYQQNYWYTSYLHDFRMYIDDKTAITNGGQFGFLANFASALTYLKGFPLYYSLSDSFSNELHNSSWKQAQLLKSYYEDFIRNCGDITLTEQVKQTWDRINAWAPGKTVPITSLKLLNGKSLDLNQFKGKALSLTFNFNDADKLKNFIDRVKKQDANKVQFIIVQIVLGKFFNSKVPDELKKLPNVTVVEVGEPESEQEQQLYPLLYQTRTFIFDPDLKIIEDNIDEEIFSINDNVFEKAMKTALVSHTMSRQQKAALIKTIGWSAGSILFACLVSWVIYRERIRSIRKKETVKRQIKELEIKAIRSQMNPHFLFNALNSIQSLINNKQYREANIYLDKFAVLMRRVLNNSEKTFVTLFDEMEAVELYCQLEKLRFDFTFTIAIDKEVDANLIEIPGMIIQPLVENSVVHGLAQKGADGRLDISIGIEGNYLKITVTDNGTGLKPQPANRKNSGFGLKLVTERLNLLNAGYAGGKLTLSGNPDGQTGTTAVLTIPID